jgi:hypothetical protein
MELAGLLGFVCFGIIVMIAGKGGSPAIPCGAKRQSVLLVPAASV